jgi:hypothetical protein
VKLTVSPPQVPTRACAVPETGEIVTYCNTGALLPQATKANMQANAVANKAN